MMQDHVISSITQSYPPYPSLMQVHALIQVRARVKHRENNLLLEIFNKDGTEWPNLLSTVERVNKTNLTACTCHPSYV